MDALSQTFSALADPTRRAILAQLASGGATVGELAEPFDMSLPAVSRHLKVLTEAGLIERHTEGQWRRCELRGEGLRSAADWIDHYRKFWEASFDRLDAFLKSTETDPSRRKESQMPDARLDNSTLHLSRIFDAPRERVFDAWVNRDQFVRWMCPPGVEITLCEVDARRGGAWRIDGRNEHGVFASSGVYLEVARPERLVFTWAHHADGDFARTRGHETTVRVELRALGDRTELTLIHGPFADAEDFACHQEGWVGSFDKLAAFLGRTA